MATVDVVTFVGGRPADFCDLGGGGDAQGVVDALEVITKDPDVRSIFFNIFGGITRCDEVARGILQALAQMGIEHPIVVRLDGTNAEEGRRLLREADASNVHTEATMLDGARRAVELAAAVSHGHPRRHGDQARRPGLDGLRGSLPRPSQPGTRHPGGRGGDPRQGRAGRRGDTDLRHRGRCGGRDRCEHRHGLRACAVRRRCDVRGDRRRCRDDRLHHRRGARPRDAADPCVRPRAWLRR